MKASTQLNCGDAATIMRELPAGSINAIITDPPYGIGSGGSGPQSFRDSFPWNAEAEARYSALAGQDDKVAGTMRMLAAYYGGPSLELAYAAFTAEWLAAAHVALADNANCLVFCDSRMTPISRFVGDAVFGAHNFRSPIVWKRHTARIGRQRFGRQHDVILHYAKGPGAIRRQQYRPYPPGYVDERFKHTAQDGRHFKLENLTAAGAVAEGPSGRPWRGIDPSGRGMGRHWAAPSDPPARVDADAYAAADTLGKLELLDAAGYVYRPPVGEMPRLIVYLDETQGIPITDVIDHIPGLASNSSERTGHPRQKPQELAELLIRTTSNPGDLILDPFAGCGTTGAAALALGRRFIGIDSNSEAIERVRERLASVRLAEAAE
jgi:DNA modification methylase